MGNPPILNRDTPARAAGTRPAATAQMRWDIYVMRDKGRRVPRSDLHAVRGTLTISAQFGSPQASIQDASGNDLGRLEDVRIRELLSSGAMLLRGTEWITHRRGTDEYPQSWWCVPWRETRSD